MNEIPHECAAAKVRPPSQLMHDAPRAAQERSRGNDVDEPEVYDEIDRRLIDTFPASDAVARY